LTALKSTDFRKLPASLIERAELRSTYVLFDLRATAANLKSLATLLLIVTGTWASYAAAALFGGLSPGKAIPVSAVSGALAEISITLCIALFVLAILYVLRWRIDSLLARRGRLWHFLKSQLQLLLTPPR